MKTGITHAIFDMDGLMFDTETMFLHSFRNIACPALGLQISEEDALKYLGLNDADSADYFLRQFGTDRWNEVFRICDEWQDACIRSSGVPVKPGLIPLLDAMKAHGIPCALASGSVRYVIERDLEASGLTGFFDAVIDGDMVSAGKPDPEIFLLAARELGCTDPSSCVVFEDSVNGMYAAAAGGFPCILIPDHQDPSVLPDAVYYRTLRTLGEAIPLLFG